MTDWDFYRSPLMKFVPSVLALLLAAAPALAQQKDEAADYPNRTVRIIVSAPPAGGPDLVARILADPLAHGRGHPVVRAKPAGGGGTRRHRRRPLRRARRLHPALGTAGAAYDARAAVQESAVRSRRARAGDHHGKNPDRAGGARGFSGQLGRRADRLRQGQSRQ